MASLHLQAQLQAAMGRLPEDQALLLLDQVNAMADPVIPVGDQALDLDSYDEMHVFRGWLADAQPNLRSGTFKLRFDTEGTNPVPHADLIDAYGEMLVVRVYRMRHNPASNPQTVDSGGITQGAVDNGVNVE